MSTALSTETDRSPAERDVVFDVSQGLGAFVLGIVSSFAPERLAPAVALCPAGGEALRALRVRPGCLLARMSGSGATCFGLFADAGSASRVASALGQGGWWSWGGAFQP